MINIVAVDDHPPMLDSLASAIGTQDDMRLVATANHGSKLISLIREYDPHVAIPDLGMSKGAFDPISSIRDAKQQFPHVKVLVITGYKNGIWARALVEAGISGYMLKSDAHALTIVGAIRAVYAGTGYFSPEIRAELERLGKHPSKLTSREHAIIILLDEGKSTQVIANCLGVSEKRIRNLLVTIGDKLGIEKNSGISPRIAIINKARELGLLPGSAIDANLFGM